MKKEDVLVISVSMSRQGRVKEFVEISPSELIFNSYRNPFLFLFNGHVRRFRV